MRPSSEHPPPPLLLPHNALNPSILPPHHPRPWHTSHLSWQVFSANLVKDAANPANNRGYGFVKYKNRESAITALDRLHNKEFPGFANTRVRQCRVQEQQRPGAV